MESLKKYLNGFLIKKHIEKVYDFVNLDLPSHTLWSAYNLGANKPEEYGKYFSWGEIDTKEKYDDDNYNKILKITKKNDAAYNDDKAYRIPTAKQIEELINYTASQMTEINGVKGIKLTSLKHTNSYIFIPLSGRMLNNIVLDDEIKAYMWSSDSINGLSAYAYKYDSETDKQELFPYSKTRGLPIRPVQSR